MIYIRSNNARWNPVSSSLSGMLTGHWSSLISQHHFPSVHRKHKCHRMRIYDVINPALKHAQSYRPSSDTPYLCIHANSCKLNLWSYTVKRKWSFSTVRQHHCYAEEHRWGTGFFSGVSIISSYKFIDSISGNRDPFFVRGKLPNNKTQNHWIMEHCCTKHRPKTYLISCRGTRLSQKPGG